MKITYSGIVSALGAAIAILVVAAHVMLLVSGADLQGSGSFANRVITLGCRFDAFALPLLALAIVLQGAAMYLAIRETSIRQPGLSFGQRLVQALFGKPRVNTVQRNLMATGSLVLVIFFIGQLSFLVGVCE